MATAISEETKSDKNNDDEVKKIDVIAVGRLVEVASRTWPGINKPGGVARVVEVHFDPSSDDENNDEKEQCIQRAGKNPTHVNVRYMVGSSREKRVPIEYVKLAPQYETHSPNKDSCVSAGSTHGGSGSIIASSLRDRSMLLGRCRRCGSLRTDCGSCDWAFEENAAIAKTSAVSTNATTSKKSSASTKRRQKGKKRDSTADSFLLGDGSDGSSNTSNDEDEDHDDYDLAQLQKLIRRTQQRRRHRKHSKNEEKSSDASSDRKSTANSKWRRRYPVLLDESSSSSDSEFNEFKHSKHRGRTMGRESLRRKGRKLASTKSVLESLPATSGADRRKNKQTEMKASSLTSASKLSRRQHSSKRSESLQLLSSSSSDSDSDGNSILSISNGRKHNKKSSPERSRNRDTLAEIPLNTARNARRIVANKVAEVDSYDRQLLDLEARARFQMEQQQSSADTLSTDVGGNDADTDFIQPEGLEAVENLPEDMVDLSRNVPYKDLGPLFDSMATKIEDEILPDFKLKMAGLHHRLRILQNEQAVNENQIGGSFDATDTRANTERLLEEYHRLWEEVRLQMVQNGTDQCRATLRRLMDDRLYRKFRKQLTVQQRKQCRGPSIMDSRNLRMDAMDDAVEAFVRKLKEAVVVCETQSEENNPVNTGSDKDDDNSNGDEIYFDDDVSSDEHDNLDFLPITAMANNDRVRSKLAPFDPHQHASRVRKDVSNQEATQSRKSLPSASKPNSSKNDHPPSRKRPRTANLNMNVTNGRSRTGRSCRSAIQVDNSDDDKEEKLQNNNVSTKVLSEEDASSYDPMENAFETDNARTSVGVGGRRKRKARSRTSQLKLSEPRSPKQSISQRMQAFLDANAANGMKICSEDEEAEAVLTQNERRLNNQTQRQRSIFEKQKERRGQHTGDSTMGAQEGVGESEDEGDRQEEQLTAYDTNALFSQLSNGIRLSKEFTEKLDDVDLSNIDRNWEGLLSEMEVALANNPESMNSLLKRAYDMLISRGSRTVQEMIAFKESELSLHIRTLSLCVRSLKFVSDDEVPIIFTKDRQECFLKLLVLQMVDALYSSILPSAWALGIEDCERVIHKMIPLRNALASCIPLVEAVSQCVIKSLESQQWRKSHCKNDIFVSSLDPQCWRSFLQKGSKFDDPQVTRFQKLGRVWPRIEVDALWRILAFISAAPSISTDKSQFRLQIVSKLFSSGVLAVGRAGTEDMLPPSEDQILACQQEIQYFSLLIRKGALDSLPKTDSMLVKLIQHSLQLQLDSFEGNGQARALCFPDSSDDLVAKKVSNLFWRMTNPQYFHSNKVNCCNVSITDLSFKQCYDKNNKTYKMLLYPTSNLLLSCLSLIIDWVNHLSLKKIRQNRLANSLKGLQNELLKDARKLSEKPVKNVDVSFEDAFSVKPPIEVGTGSERARIFKSEAAAYIQIIGSLCMKKIDPGLPQTVWKNISDNTMKKKQCDIIRCHRSTDTYTGDPYLLFVTAKIMATLLFVQMNISPWHLSLDLRITRLLADNLQLESESLLFPLSCIFACLDCLCDLEVGPQVFSQFYEIIILVFRNLSAIVASGEGNLATDQLKSKCTLNFNSVLIKCIRMHLVSSKGSHETFHLRLCLSSIRAIHSFVTLHYHETEASAANGADSAAEESLNIPNEDNGDDMWGDLDDSDLAALDLPGISEDRNEQQENMWELLSDALEQSKPSKRFAILRSTPGMISGLSFNVSSIGKYLISEEVNKICDCFSTAMVSIEAQGTMSSDITKIVSKWSKPSYENNEDSQYVSQIARKMTLELCFLAEKYPVCRNFISEHATNMLFNFVKALVDPSRLEKLPSCNLERIGESSGRVGTDQAILMLDLFNDDSFQETNDQRQGSTLRKLQNRRRKSATEIWDFCFKLGTAFAKNDLSDSASVTMVGNSLLNPDNDLLQEFNFLDDVISLENETFKTFRLLRNIVSYSAINYTGFHTFESVSSFLLLLLADHILSIVQSLKYNDQTSSGREYKKARLTELLTSFVELFVSSAAWILREGAKNRSKAWSFLQSYLRDRLFSPILKSQPIDTTIALQEIIAAARFVCAGPHGEGVSLPAIHCVGLVDCSKYLGGYFFTSVLRRSKELIVATALNPQNLGLQNALLEAVIGSSDDLEEVAPWIVGAKFPLGQSRSIGSRVVWPYSSPIQKQIDEYLQFVDENLSSSKRIATDDWWNCIATTKNSFLKNHVIPRLHSSSLGMEKKRRIIMLLSYMLEYNTQSARAHGSDESRKRTIDVPLVREIIKALRSNLHRCLMQFSVDNHVARAIFSCSIHLGNSCLLLDDKEQNLVSWSHAKIIGAKGKTMLDLSNSEVLGSYVWIFFQWLRTLGEMVIDQDGGDAVGTTTKSIESMRRHWRETQCCRFGGLDEERLDLEHNSNDFETWDRLLIDFEDLALPSKTKSDKNIMVNIYAKPSIPHGKDHSNDKSSLLWEPWNPSISVKKNLKEMMAVILTTS